MEKYRELYKVRVIKIIQLFLVISNVFLFTRHFDTLLVILPLLICLILESIIPEGYGWGLAAKKNVYFKSISPAKENIIFMILVIILSALVGFFALY